MPRIEFFFKKKNHAAKGTYIAFKYRHRSSANSSASTSIVISDLEDNLEIADSFFCHPPDNGNPLTQDVSNKIKRTPQYSMSCHVGGHLFQHKSLVCKSQFIMLVCSKSSNPNFQFIVKLKKYYCALTKKVHCGILNCVLIYACRSY